MLGLSHLAVDLILVALLLEPLGRRVLGEQVVCERGRRRRLVGCLRVGRVVLVVGGGEGERGDGRHECAGHMVWDSVMELANLKRGGQRRKLWSEWRHRILLEEEVIQNGKRMVVMFLGRRELERRRGCCDWYEIERLGCERFWTSSFRSWTYTLTFVISYVEMEMYYTWSIEASSSIIYAFGFVLD